MYFSARRYSIWIRALGFAVLTGYLAYLTNTAFSPTLTGTDTHFAGNTMTTTKTPSTYAMGKGGRRRDNSGQARTAG